MHRAHAPTSRAPAAYGRRTFLKYLGIASTAGAVGCDTGSGRVSQHTGVATADAAPGLFRPADPRIDTNAQPTDPTLPASTTPLDPSYVLSKQIQVAPSRQTQIVCCFICARDNRWVTIG